MNERVSAKPGGTNWQRLCAMSAAEIKSGIEADLQARRTDVDFWIDAKAVLPQAKKG